MNELLLSKNYGVKQFLKKGKILACAFCKKQIYCRPSQLSRKRFCSRSCALKNAPRKPKTGRFQECDFCKKEIWIYPRDFFRKRHFCSRNCQKSFDYGGKIEVKCLACGSLYKTYVSQIIHRGESKYCSLNCRTMFRKKKYLAKKRKKRTSNAILKKQLWIHFSEYIRQRDKGMCISCGKRDFWRKMDAGHYIPKTAGLSLYFNERNVNCQCTYCNRWMHGNLSKYAIALRKKYGETILEDLEKERYKIMKITDNQYIELIEKYKNLKLGFAK